MHDIFLSYDQPDLIFRDGSLPVNARQATDVSLVLGQLLHGFEGAKWWCIVPNSLVQNQNVQFALVPFWAWVVAYPGLVPETFILVREIDGNRLAFNAPPKYPTCTGERVRLSSH